VGTLPAVLRIVGLSLRFSIADLLRVTDHCRQRHAMKNHRSRGDNGFGRAWFALTVAFALHVLDEATTGFLAVYNPTVIAMRTRWGWFPMPTFEFREWLVGLILAVAVCFALTPPASRGARWLRPLAWLYAVIHLLNALGHTLGTIYGHTVASVTFSRPAPGFYSSPCLFIGSIWLMVRLRQTAVTINHGQGRTNRQNPSP
jgi:hypothetical protein